MLNLAEQEISPSNKSQITNNWKFFLAKHRHCIISRKNFMLSWVEHEKSFLTSGPGESAAIGKRETIFANKKSLLLS